MRSPFHPCEHKAESIIISHRGRDASHFGALIHHSDWDEQGLDPGRPRPPSEEVLLEQIYKDLAALHSTPAVPVTVEFLRGATLDYHAFNWSHCPFTMGAFAHFGPGQFSRFYPEIIRSAGHGRFHFAGEIASPYHGWIAGGLDSAERVVWEILMQDILPLLPEPVAGLPFWVAAGFPNEEVAIEAFLWGIFAEFLDD